MWLYQKALQHPIHIKNPDPRMAHLIAAHYGGPDGELGASLRYLSQRFSMPTEISRAVLNDIGTEELGHMEMMGTMVRQLLKCATPEQIKKAKAEAYFTDHGSTVYPADAVGVSFTAANMQSLEDAVATLKEDMEAEQKARTAYEDLIKLCDDPDVLGPLRFLREREVVHHQRFGETLSRLQADMEHKKYY